MDSTKVGGREAAARRCGGGREGAASFAGDGVVADKTNKDAYAYRLRLYLYVLLIYAKVPLLIKLLHSYDEAPC